jgi:glycine hydroxymethyltransferase
MHDLDEFERFIQHFLYYRDARIPLVASENSNSKLLKASYLLSLSQQYCSRLPSERERITNLTFGYVDPIDDMNKLTRDAVLSLFKATDCEVRCLSGINALTTILFAITKDGDTILKIADSCGGPLFIKPICERIGVKVVEMELNDGYQLDPYYVAELYEQFHPRIIFLDSSYMLFPHPVKEIRELLPSALILYDGSQVLGLIAGGQFQDPFREGADIIHGTTHKTFFGPQKSLILFKDNGDLVQAVQSTAANITVSNTHLHHILGLYIACLELKTFGKEYALKTIQYAQYFAKMLDESGFNVVETDRGYTESHQIWIDCENRNNAEKMFVKLSDAHISTNLIFLPHGRWGIRLGVAELVRRGAEMFHIEKLVELMKASVFSEADNNKIANECLELNKELEKNVQYSFDDTVEGKKIIDLLLCTISS